MKALIIDHISTHVPEGLKSFGIEVDFKILPTKAELIGIIDAYDILAMRVDPIIDRDILQAATNLKMLCSCSAGMNHVDTKFAEEKNIAVVNAPGMNFNAVAELTIGKMLDLSRQSMAAKIGRAHV